MGKIIAALAIAMVVGWTGLQAQTKYTVTGTAKDDAGEAVAGASVMVLQASDSILAGFALTAADGSFKIAGIAPGDYVFKCMLLKHNTFVKSFQATGASETIDLGPVTMVPEAAKLDVVEITDERQPIRLKGDTIEYDAKAFQTQQGDNVEQLLKKLPGMEVDNDGNVKAQGKDVVKVLVDGKEFFGSDPKVATKNLPSGAIDKVQVFDKRSDMADFTGVDDGTRDRTINLTLKEEYKKGYFGNVLAGYGTKNRFEGKANLSRFADKSQMSIISQANNTNQQSFTMQEYMNFMGGMQNMGGGGGMGGNGGGGGGMGGGRNLGIQLGTNPNSGFYTSGSGGFNGNWDLGKKTKVTASYFYSAMQKQLEREAWKQTILENGSYLTTDNGSQLDLNQNHRGNLIIRHDLDTLTRINLRTTAAYNTTSSDVSNLTTSTQPSGVSNASDQNSFTDGSVQEINSNLNLMHRFRKRGRSMNLTGNFRYNPQSKTIDLTSMNAFTLNDSTSLLDTVRQNQLQDVGLLVYGGSATYSEPIGKHSVLDASVNWQQTQNELEKSFYDLDRDGANPVFNLLLSNAYESSFTYGKAGLNYRIFTSKLNINAGVGVQKSQLDGLMLLTNTPIRKDFLNVLPSVDLRYNLNKKHRLSLRYSTQVGEPLITQLQPVPDNSNPLNISVGNPDLGAEYVHNVRANHNFFDQFSFVSAFSSLSATYTTNKISSLTTVDSLLRQVTMPVNVASDLNLNANTQFSTPIRKLQMKVTVGGNSSYARSIVFINGVENFVNRYTESGDLRLENKKKEHFDANIGGRVSYTVTNYPDASDLNQSYLNSGLFGEVSVYLPRRITVMTGLDASIYSGGGFNSQQIVPLWRAYVSKKIFKNGRGELRVSAYDMLNRNVGITRTAQLNYQQEEKVNTLSRFIIGSFSYNIVAIGKK